MREGDLGEKLGQIGEMVVCFHLFPIRLGWVRKINENHLLARCVL
jgi:hypothetical protein